MDPYADGRMMRTCRILLPLALLPAAVLLASCVEPGHAVGEWETMGGRARVEVHTLGEKDAPVLLDEIRASMDLVDRAMNDRREDSLLAVVNRKAYRKPHTVSDRDLFRCIKMALEYAKRTDGAFDPTVGLTGPVGWEKVELFEDVSALRFLDRGLQLRLGGIAGGYALDAAARNFARTGVRAGFLELCGSVYGWGTPPDRDAWEYVLRSRREPALVLGTLMLYDRALSTSGDYATAWSGAAEDGPVILDPTTGMPASTDVFAATVLSDSGIEADALSTAFVAAGSQKAASILERSERIEAILLVRTGRGPAVLASSTLRARLVLDPGFEEKIDGRVRYLLPSSYTR